MASGLTVEPGSNKSVMARLRRLCGAASDKLFGLNDGLFTIANTSPVLTSTTMAEPEVALYDNTADFTAL